MEKENVRHLSVLAKLDSETQDTKQSNSARYRGRTECDECKDLD